MLPLLVLEIQNNDNVKTRAYSLVIYVQWFVEVFEYSPWKKLSCICYVL